MAYVVDRDVAAIPPDSSPATQMPFTLTPTARNWGAQDIEWVDSETDRAELHRKLQRFIYQGRTVWDLTHPSIFCGLAVLILLPWAIAADRKAFHQLRNGVVRKGPVKVRAAEFNERMGSDGIGFTTTEPPTIWERLQKTTAQPPIVRIARRDEAGHFLRAGDSGSGKSSVIRQMLRQIRERGETAVVYDPEIDFTPEFYDPARGDAVCNPIDARMPYWSISDETRFPPEASALAHSVLQDDSAPSIGTARAVFVHLLEHYRPSTEELAAWMSDLKEVERRIAKTPLARLLGESRRWTVKGLFQRIAEVLQLLPRENECPGRWNAASWALERQGWLFFPVRPEVRESTCRLIRLWLDAVLLHLATIPPKALANGRQRSLSTTAPGRSTDTRPPRLFFVDESSLASTRQVNDFLKRLRARDRVIFVGDARQHQGVEAGRPFEQLQQAGMQTARLDQIVRQRDPGLKQAVEQLARGEVREGIENLARQGRVHEIADPKKRMSAIAADYAAQPGNTLVVSPDNASRIERSTGSFTKRYRRERRSRRQNIARPYSRPARS